MAQHGVNIAPVLTDDASVQDMGPGGVLNQLPSLKQSSDIARTQITSFNEYKNITADEYSAQHPNAQSDGDQLGRGETGPNSTVGTLTDEQKKDLLLYSSGNKFKPGMGYNNLDFPEQHW